MKSHNQKGVPVGAVLQPLPEAKTQLELVYHPFDLAEAGIDLEEVLGSQSLREALDRIEAQGVEPAIEIREVERLVVEREHTELALLPKKLCRGGVVDVANNAFVDTQPFPIEEGAEAVLSGPAGRKLRLLERCRHLAILYNVIQDQDDRQRIRSEVNRLVRDHLNAERPKLVRLKQALHRRSGGRIVNEQKFQDGVEHSQWLVRCVQGIWRWFRQPWQVVTECFQGGVGLSPCRSIY